MIENDRDYLALFIDWDNMAISIAADMGGANVDLKKIVQQAQSYGTITVARAYAEWSSTTERLNVYKLGVDPIYAPTFRFEPDPMTGSRSKSLADPVMVTDCIDLLHTMPHIGTYLIVSGDKDLIPVVRLAQLRGRRVIVIGPDYVAGVLRDMADEYVPYRRLLEGSEAVRPTESVEQPTHTRRSSRSSSPASSSSSSSSPRQNGRSQQQSSRSQSGSSRSSRNNESYIATLPPAAALPPINATDTFEEPVEEVEEHPVVEEQPAATTNGNGQDLESIIALMGDILREKLNEGRTRLRATNLKDILMARIPGFSERRYGFTKFKDLLAAAERAGTLTVSMNGPVHWVALAEPATEEPAQEEQSAQAQEEPEKTVIEEAAPTPTPAPTAVVASSPAPVVATPVTVEISEELRNNIIRFIAELSQRSQFMTKNYTLTSLTSFLNQTMPQAQSEAAAREILTELINQDVLQEDREPQEIQVGPNKHRLRMCHLNKEHPLVQAAIAQPQEAAPEQAAAEAPAVTEEAKPAAESVEPAEEESEEAPAANGRRRRRRRTTRTTKTAATTTENEAEGVSPENMEELVSEILQMRAATPEVPAITEQETPTAETEPAQAEQPAPETTTAEAEHPAPETAPTETVVAEPVTDEVSPANQETAAPQTEEPAPEAETESSETVPPATHMGEQSEPVVAVMSYGDQGMPVFEQAEQTDQAQAEPAAPAEATEQPPAESEQHGEQTDHEQHTVTAGE